MATRRKMLPRLNHTALLLLLLLLLHSVHAQSLDDLCEPERGYELFVTLKEDTEIGTVVNTINTRGEPDEVNLTMDKSDVFAFDPASQQVSLNRSLDADVSDSSLTVTFRCVELVGGPSQPVRISIIVSVKDVNDNPPVFTQNNYTIFVGETTSVNSTLPMAGIVHATDADSSFPNNAIYYSILPGPFSDYFAFVKSLRPNTLQLMKALDYENLTTLTVTVVATNKGSSVELNATAELTVQVMDEDDLNPVFSTSVYRGTVLEGAPTGTVISVSPVIRASDADLTLNAPVSYSFHGTQAADDVFSIDPTTAEIRLVGSIKPGTVSIVVQATQKDNPSRYGIAMLVIVVEGVSVRAPQFCPSFYRAFVSEAVPRGTTVLFVSAIDDDIGATIKYGIRDTTNLFQISPDSGAVSLTGGLDFELASSHTFIVTASDGFLESEASVEVTVLDANDNSPQILNQKPIEVEMERTNGSVVAVIQVSDLDAGTQFGFRLETYSSLFSIDATGTIRLSAEAPDLTESQYLLLVAVTDNAESPRETFEVVTVHFEPLTSPDPAVTTVPTKTSTKSTKTTTTTKTSEVPSTVVMAGATDDTIAIALGVVAAVFLAIIILLVVYICKRRKQSSEELDKVKANRSPDPRGLKFKNAGRMRDINFRGEMEEASDGETTVQENPLKAGAFNYGFVHPDDAESDRNLDEIHIETAVIPYGAADVYNNNDGLYEDSSEYGDTLPSKHALMNGLYSTSSESVDTARTDSSEQGKHRLVANGSAPIKQQAGKSTTPWGSGGGQVLQTISLEGLDPDVSVAPRDQKSELTVYF